MRAGALRHQAPPAPELPKLRAPIVFGVLAMLFFGLVGRSMYLQWIDNEFLPTQGSARHSREIEEPAHRGRIVDRFGEPLALSTPVKSLWVFPDKFEATPEQLAQLARILDTTPQRVRAQIDAHDDFAFVARQIAPETSERAMALRIKGLNDQNEYRRFDPGGEVTAHVIGFTGVETASTSPKRSTTRPRCAGSSISRENRAAPFSCRKPLSTHCR